MIILIDSNKLSCNPWHVLNKKPITADIFLTNFCNNKCQYCVYDRWGLKDEQRYMNYDDFVKYVQILLNLGVKGIILTGGGEPTLNPDFDKIAAYLEENKIPYGINTNFNVPKKIAPKYLKVSLDASNANEYAEVRGVDAYDKVIENIKMYRAWQKENNVKTSLGVQCIARSPQHVNRFYNSVKNLDVDYIVFRPVESIAGKTYSSYKRDLNRIYTINNLIGLQDVDKRVAVNYKFRCVHFKPKECYANFAQIAIDEQGNVMYCCHKPYEIVGHIRDADILSKKEKYRTDMSKCDIPCRLSGCNRYLKNMERLSPESMFI